MNAPENHVQTDESVLVQDKVLQDLAQAARSVEEAREQERQTLARELHDRVVQPLVALVTAMDIQSEELPDTGLVADWMPTRKALAHEALEAVRDIVAGLHTHPYELQSLPSALREYLAPLFYTRGVRVLVESHDWPEHLPPEWAFHLYLTVREAVINAERHGRATEIRVLLRADAERLQLVISDNGTGFQPGEPGASDADRARTGLGIANMRDRVRLLGGDLTLGSVPGGGVRVTITGSLPARTDSTSEISITVPPD